VVVIASFCFEGEMNLFGDRRRLGVDGARAKRAAVGERMGCDFLKAAEEGIAEEGRFSLSL
jgi:hypothetical protein